MVLGDGGALLDLFGDFDAFGDVGVGGSVVVSVSVSVSVGGGVRRGVEGFDEEAVEDAIDGDDGCFFCGR